MESNQVPVVTHTFIIRDKDIELEPILGLKVTAIEEVGDGSSQNSKIRVF
jgi:hypothetical protein